MTSPAPRLPSKSLLPSQYLKINFFILWTSCFHSEALYCWPILFTGDLGYWNNLIIISFGVLLMRSILKILALWFYFAFTLNNSAISSMNILLTFLIYVSTEQHYYYYCCIFSWNLILYFARILVIHPTLINSPDFSS